jgi:transcriptional regulator with GAF, ATPase, and Fis domain
MLRLANCEKRSATTACAPEESSVPYEQVARIVKETVESLKKPRSKTAKADRAHQDREEIIRVLSETNGRVGGPDGAAARMGINRTTLISRMKKLGIRPEDVKALGVQNPKIL